MLRAVDAVVVHSAGGQPRRVVEEAAVPAERVHVIPHGAFDAPRRACRRDHRHPRSAGWTGRRVVLFFGLVRPYKGVDLLVEAFAGTPDDVVLLVVGMPRMPLAPLERRARELGIADRVRFVPRFVPDAELPAYFRRADVVALPYREIEQSGVLYTALAFGTPLLLSAVGGFPEIARARRRAAGRAGQRRVAARGAGRAARRRAGAARAVARPRWRWRPASTPGSARRS